MRMRTRSVDQRTAIAVVIRSAVFVTLVLVASAAGADGDDGLRCWLRTSAGAIRVGEPFSLVVTCQAADTEGLSIVVDESKLDPTTVQFPPFDVLGGARAADLRGPGVRFFQYEYNLRLVNDLWFERDIPLPDLTLTYRQKTGTGAGEAILGIERTYLLPREFLHVASLVPDTASDIRDATDATFRDIQAAAFHADTLMSAGAAAATLGGAFALVGLVRLAGGRRARAAERPVRPLSPPALLRALARELGRVRREREAAGWTPALVARALAAWRIAGTLMVGGAPTQRLAAGGALPDGALILRRRLWTSEPRVVSGHATPPALERVASAAPAARTTSAETRAAMQEALATFTRASYSSTAVADDTLDPAFEAGADAVRSAARQQSWPARALRRRRLSTDEGTPRAQSSRRAAN
jgi:hypothetical protein